MKEYYDIAVIGESMAGKSTWIANLFQGDIAKKLRSLSTQNQEGQTKISVYYRLQSPEEKDFHVVGIGWNQEKLAQVLKAGKYPKAFEEFMSALKIPYQSEAESVEMLLGGLDDYFQTDGYIACLRVQNPFDLLQNVINNEEIGDLEIISHVEMAGAASDEVWAEMKKYSLGWVRIRDTRGFMDETVSKMKEYLESSKKSSRQPDSSVVHQQPVPSEEELKAQYLRNLLDDRGIYDIDACVFIGIAGSNALAKKNLKAIYGPLIKYMVEKHPVFLTLRSDRLTDVCQDDTELDYESAIEQDDNGVFIQLGKNFTGFRDMRKLLHEFGLSKETGDYHTELVQKHYCELVLADIQTEGITEDESCLFEEIYRKTAVGAFAVMLKRIQSYVAILEKVEGCLKSLNEGSGVEKVWQIFDNKFLAGIETVVVSGGEGASREEFYNRYGAPYITKVLAKKVCEPYRGGLVGVRGGLTTQMWVGGRVGDVAIAYLETAYRIREEMHKNLTEIWAEEIKSKNMWTENGKDAEDIERVKQCLKLFFKRKSDQKIEHLSSVGRMIHREYLESAYNSTREELEIEGERIGKYLDELKELPNNREWSAQQREMWVSERYEMSVEYQMLYDMLKSSLI